MTDIVKIEPLVLEILETEEETRSDDYLLFLTVTRHVNSRLLQKPLDEVLSDHYKNGLPNWESVTRARRKIQSRRPEKNRKAKRVCRICKNLTTRFPKYHRATTNT